MADLVAGRGRETFALPPAVGVAGAIANLPHAAPLHRLHPRDALPTRLLTPFQAENDYHVRDTYNYLTVQADIRMPRRHFKYLEDVSRLDAFAAAVAIAVERLRADARDARVLHLGCGAGVMSMEALRAGAHHVVAADRWLYHAMAAKENLLNNGFGDDQARVVYKRPTDLAAIRDVPVSCNLCVNEMLDDGLLTAGLLPSFRHASRELLLPDAILIPSSATVYAMPVEMRVDRVRGLDVSPIRAPVVPLAHLGDANRTRRVGSPRAPLGGVALRLSEPAGRERRQDGRHGVRTRRQVQRRRVLVRLAARRRRVAQHRARGISPGRENVSGKRSDAERSRGRTHSRDPAHILTSRGAVHAGRDGGAPRRRDSSDLRAQHRSRAIFRRGRGIFAPRETRRVVPAVPLRHAPRRRAREGVRRRHRATSS